MRRKTQDGKSLHATLPIVHLKDMSTTHDGLSGTSAAQSVQLDPKTWRGGVLRVLVFDRKMLDHEPVTQ